MTNSPFHSLPHPLPTSSTPWSGPPALGDLAYPSAPSKEQQWPGSSEQLEVSEFDVDEDRKDTLVSSLLSSSILSILHHHHTSPSSGHLHTTATTDTTDTVPDISELWVTGRGTHTPLFCLMSSPLATHNVEKSRAKTTLACAFLALLVLTNNVMV